MSSEPPKHDMVYFPNMTNLASSSGEFRKVLHTGLYSQLVLMTIPVGGDIGDEVHTVDQILTFTSGQAKATVNGKDQDLKAGDLVVSYQCSAAQPKCCYGSNWGQLHGGLAVLKPLTGASRIPPPSPRPPRGARPFDKIKFAFI